MKKRDFFIAMMIVISIVGNIFFGFDYLKRYFYRAGFSDGSQNVLNEVLRQAQNGKVEIDGAEGTKLVLVPEKNLKEK